MKKKNKGVTLIALVVTIIVLLILASISIAMLTGQNGIITRANQARDETIKGREKEEIALAYLTAKTINYQNGASVVTAEDLQNALRGNGVENANTSQEEDRIKIEYTDSGNTYYIDENGTVTEPIVRTGLKVGDYINYTPDTADAYPTTKLQETISGANQTDMTQETLNWQILRMYDNGTMDLIGSRTNQNLDVRNVKGYNNGVYVLHDICEQLYSKPSKGITARSVNYEDLEVWLTEEGKAARDNFIDLVQYGETKTYTNANRRYPEIYAYEKGAGISSTTVEPNGIGRSDKTATNFDMPTTKSYLTANTTGLTVTQTFWYAPMNEENFGDGYKALRNEDTSSYWLASRYVNCKDTYAEFGLCASGLEMRGNTMFRSSATNSFNTYRIRPVVSLSGNIQITQSTGENSPSNPHTINW